MSSSQSESCASSVIGIHHVGMSVTDLKASVEFYSQALGVRLQNTPDTMRTEDASLGFSTPSNSAVLAFPNGYLKLSEYDRSDFSPPPVLPVKGPGITHVCYQSPTSEDIYQRLINGGATTVSRGEQPVHLLGQGVYYAYARDHDGIMYETEHLDHAPFEGPIWLSHAALVSPDLDRLVEFYSLLLDAKPNRRTDRASGPRFDEVAGYDNVMIRAAWFDIGNMILEMWQFVNPVTPEPQRPSAIEDVGYNKVAFEVSDLQKEYERLTALGVRFLSSPATSVDGWEACLRDPDGNLISLIQPKTQDDLSVSHLKQKTW